MKVCYFGIYNSDYSRNRVLIKGLKENSVEVVECRVNPGEKYKYWKLYKKHRQIKDYDVMIVGFPGHPVMLLARLICKKPIIFDAFVSSYETLLDRKNYLPRSLRVLKHWCLDWLACRLADRILLDTKEHIEYFIRTFKIERKKFKRVFVGVDNMVFYPRHIKKDIDEFLVVFHGTYIPLQGIEYIVKAAKILEHENIRFHLIGKGQTYKKAVTLSRELNTKNISFIDFKPQEKLTEYIAQANICLGVFGNTAKAKRIIPNKACEVIAMRKPLITADTPASRELLTNKKNCLFCKIADSYDLSKKILELKDDFDLREKIANNGYKLYREKLTPKTLGRELKDLLVKNF